MPKPAKYPRVEREQLKAWEEWYRETFNEHIPQHLRWWIKSRYRDHGTLPTLKETNSWRREEELREVKKVVRGADRADEIAAELYLQFKRAAVDDQLAEARRTEVLTKLADSLERQIRLAAVLRGQPLADGRTAVGGQIHRQAKSRVLEKIAGKTPAEAERELEKLAGMQKGLKREQA